VVIRELKPSDKVQGRWLVILEDGSILRVSENEVIGFALYTGKELGEEETEQLLESLHRSQLKEKTIALLARKPMSRRELERKLGEWEAGEEEIIGICSRMEELGFLNDREYAARVVRHYSAKGYGQRRLKDELYRRGVPRDYWEEALEQAGDSCAAIDAFLEKKLAGKTPDRKELKKVTDALARRGFSWAQIDEAVRRCGIEPGEF
jgi:regulatory protein